MEITMLENGLDFIISAILHLREAEQDNCKNKENEIKYSLLHLSSGIELILKSRLYKEHWTYIFSDMNKADKELLINGSFKSVESSLLIERLKKLCNIDINKNSVNAFQHLRNLRNQMEHFTIKASFLAIEACINNGLSEINSFIAKNYNDFISPVCINLNEDINEFGLTKKEKNLIDELVKYTSELKKHYDDALKIAKVKADKEGFTDNLIECPSCKEKLLIYGYFNTCYCFFCGYKEDSESAAYEYLDVIQEIDMYDTEISLYECPDCGSKSFIYANGKFICFSCGTNYNKNEIGFCNECGEVYIHCNDELEICPSCIENKFYE